MALSIPFKYFVVVKLKNEPGRGDFKVSKLKTTFDTTFKNSTRENNVAAVLVTELKNNLSAFVQRHQNTSFVGSEKASNDTKKRRKEKGRETEERKIG